TDPKCDLLHDNAKPHTARGRGDGIKKLPTRWQKCVGNAGDYMRSLHKCIRNTIFLENSIQNCM
ncbi:hypothetical protein L9F63_006184, partial [Diploptera punctata]